MCFEALELIQQQQTMVKKRWVFWILCLSHIIHIGKDKVLHNGHILFSSHSHITHNPNQPNSLSKNATYKTRKCLHDEAKPYLSKEHYSFFLIFVIFFLLLFFESLEASGVSIARRIIYNDKNVSTKKQKNAKHQQCISKAKCDDKKKDKTEESATARKIFVSSLPFSYYF